jgi:hypothetical protein
MSDELLVIIGAELILLVSIAAMKFYGTQMDVLSGHYFNNATDRPVSLGWKIDRLRWWVVGGHWLKKARAPTLNAGRLRPSATSSRGRTVKTIPQNRRHSRSPVIPGSHEVDNRVVRPGQARSVTRAMGWG